MRMTVWPEVLGFALELREVLVSLLGTTRSAALGTERLADPLVLWVLWRIRGVLEAAVSTVRDTVPETDPMKLELPVYRAEMWCCPIGRDVFEYTATPFLRVTE